VKLDARIDVHFYVTCYAYNPYTGGLLVPCRKKNKSFNIRDLTFFMLSSFNQENNVNVTQDPALYRPFTLWKTTLVPKEDPECPNLLFIVVLLVSTLNNIFLVPNYCQFSLLFGFLYLSNLLNLA
jgi:hypothetical protein